MGWVVLFCFVLLFEGREQKSVLCGPPRIAVQSPGSSYSRPSVSSGVCLLSNTELLPGRLRIASNLMKLE